VKVKTRYNLRILLLVLAALSAGCTSTAKMPDSGESDALINGCNIVEHAKCVYLTGKETLEDSYNRQFTRHWWRMSYIGQACEERYGKTFATIFEAVFAIPHYTAIAIGNSVGAMFSPLVEASD